MNAGSNLPFHSIPFNPSPIHIFNPCHQSIPLLCPFNLSLLSFYLSIPPSKLCSFLHPSLCFSSISRADHPSVYSCINPSVLLSKHPVVHPSVLCCRSRPQTILFRILLFTLIGIRTGFSLSYGSGSDCLIRVRILTV